MAKHENALILGTRKGLLILERASGTWKIAHQAFPGVPVSYAFRDSRTGTLWAGLDHGHWGQKLHRSRDSGRTWEEIEMPRYPDGAEIRDGVPASLSYIWVIAPGGEDQPERLYMGTEPGGLFASDDGGDSFHLVAGLWEHPSRKTQWFGGGRDHPGVHSVVVDPRDSRRVLVGISVAGVFETLNDGATWEPRNRGLVANYLPNPDAEVGHDPHCLVAHPRNPEVLMQQNHCGIFRSLDGGRSWRDVSQPGGPAYFGFPLVMDLQDPDTAWVVPAVSDEKRMAINGAMVVCRTEDGGDTWQEFRQGLPQDGCFDYAYRHALDITGDSLAFGTTSGNLLISNDRGESWEAIGHYYPLIYSVRFL